MVARRTGVQLVESRAARSYRPLQAATLERHARVLLGLAPLAHVVLEVASRIRAAMLLVAGVAAIVRQVAHVVHGHACLPRALELVRLARVVGVRQLCRILAVSKHDVVHGHIVNVVLLVGRQVERELSGYATQAYHFSAPQTARLAANLVNDRAEAVALDEIDHYVTFGTLYVIEQFEFTARTRRLELLRELEHGRLVAVALRVRGHEHVVALRGLQRVVNARSGLTVVGELVLRFGARPIERSLAAVLVLAHVRLEVAVGAHSLVHAVLAVTHEIAHLFHGDHLTIAAVVHLEQMGAFVGVVALLIGVQVELVDGDVADCCAERDLDTQLEIDVVAARRTDRHEL